MKILRLFKNQTSTGKNLKINEEEMEKISMNFNSDCLLNPSGNTLSPLLSDILIYVNCSEREEAPNNHTKIHLVCKSWLIHWNALIYKNILRIQNDSILKHDWSHFLTNYNKDQRATWFYGYKIKDALDNQDIKEICEQDIKEICEQASKIDLSFFKTVRLFSESYLFYKKQHDPEKQLRAYTGNSFNQCKYWISRLNTIKQMSRFLNRPLNINISPADPYLVTYLKESNNKKHGLINSKVTDNGVEWTQYSFTSDNIEKNLSIRLTERQVNRYRNPFCRISIGPKTGEHFNISGLFSDQPPFVLSGVIYHFPEQILGFSGLTHLEIVEQCIDTLPDSLASLILLNCLRVVSCHLKSVNSNLGNITTLTTLDLSNNLIKILPESIGNLQSLTTLNLQSNCLIELPSSLSKLTKLREINLSFPKSTFYPLTPLIPLPNLENSFFLGWPMANISAISSSRTNTEEDLRLLQDYPRIKKTIKHLTAINYNELEMMYRDSMCEDNDIILNTNSFKVAQLIIGTVLTQIAISFFLFKKEMIKSTLDPNASWLPELENYATKAWNHSWWQQYTISIVGIIQSEILGRYFIATENFTPRTIRKCSQAFFIALLGAYYALPLFMRMSNSENSLSKF